MSTEVEPTDKSAVFVVHGRNDGARTAMFAFLRAIGLRPIEWTQAVAMTGQASPYIGQILDVAFSKAQAVVVLLTPDDVSYLRTEYSSEGDPETKPEPQARPNVLFEAGMALGRHPDRTVLVELGRLRPFSDVAGRHSVRLNNNTDKRQDLAQRLGTAGCTVDLTGTDWHNAGDFTPPPEPGGGRPLGRRAPSSSNSREVHLDAQFHSAGRSHKLQIINRGTEPVYDLAVKLPENAAITLHGGLPEKLPPGKSVSVAAILTWGDTLGGTHGGTDAFEITLTGRSASGNDFSEDVFIDTGA
jgi:hypothetical protein